MTDSIEAQRTRGAHRAEPRPGPFLRRLHRYLEETPTAPGPRAVQAGIQILILVNVVAAILESVGSLGARYGALFFAVESVSIAAFSVEYVARVAASTADARFARPVVGRIRYALRPMSLVDLVTVLPAYLPWIVGLDMRWLRALRLMRVFRLLKVARYSRALKSLGSAFFSRKEELAITGFAALIVLVLAASVLHLAEREAQPDAFGSVPAAAWWAITTLTTVGYGDTLPVTPWGKTAASIVAIVGIALFALPAGILGSAFVDQLKTSRVCPHCGKELLP